MIVRPFDPRDQEAARRLVLEGLGEHFGSIDESMNPDLDDIERAYLAAGHVFVVAESGGAIVGAGGLLFEAPGEARVVRMSVRASDRRRGVASSVLAALLDEARRRSRFSVFARTQPEWDDAISFYRQAGFERCERDEVDVHLRLELQPAG